MSPLSPADQPRPNRRRRLVGDPWMLAIPALFLIWQILLYQAKGPNWVMIPQDLSYNYLLNGVNALSGIPLGTLIHPALTTVLYMCVVILGTWLVAGHGSIAESVVADPESYFQVAAHGWTILSTLALWVMGRMALRGLKSRALVVTAQSLILLAPATYAVLNSFASPESMLTALIMIQVGLCLQSLDGRLDDPAQSRHFAILSALIGAAAIATKFLAAPILLAPLILLPTWRGRVVYMVAGVIFGLIALSPLALPGHRGQFISDMVALMNSAVSEGQSRGSGFSLTGLWIQIRPMVSHFPLFLTLCGGLTVCAGALALHGPWRRHALACQPWALRAFVAALTVSCAAVLYISGRPKPHYLTPFLPVLGMGIAAAGIVLCSWKGEAWRLKWRTWFAFSGLALALLAFGEIRYSHTGFDYVQRIGINAVATNRQVFESSDNKAVVTAIQASNIPTAMHHANSTTGYAHWQLTEKYLPRYHYDYGWEGQNSLTHAGHAVPFTYLAEMYDRVLFWASTGNFANNEWRVGIDAVWRNLRSGEEERLAEFEGISLLLPWRQSASPQENRTNGWMEQECGTGLRCLHFKADKVNRKILSHIRLTGTTSASHPMPVNWKIQGSDDASAWIDLESIVDGRIWNVPALTNWPDFHPKTEENAPNRVYRLNHARSFKYYRLILPADRMPLAIGAYAAGGCSPHQLNLPVYTKIVQDQTRSALPELTFFQSGSWEAVGPMPHSLTAEAAAPWRPTAYIMGTGNDGVNGSDSTPRMPMSWSLESSMDGKSWTILDQKSAQPAWAINETRRFILPENVPTGRLYRLVVQETRHPEVLRLYHLSVEGETPEGVADIQTKRKRGLGTHGFHESSLANAPLIIQSAWNTPTQLTAYGMGVGPFADDSIRRMPKSWTLYGSANGTDWVVLDRRSQETQWTTFERRAFSISAPQTVRVTRLVIDSANGYENVARLSHLYYFEPRTRPLRAGCPAP